MSEQRPSLADRFQTQPRAIRWLVLAVAFVLLFQAWHLTAGEVVADWNTEAADIQRKVATLRQGADLTGQLDAMEDVIRGLGQVTQPRRENPGRAGLSNAVVEVLKNPEYSIDDEDFQLRGGNKLPKNISAPIVGEEKRISRLTGELTFIASPEDAIAIIGDFERRPDIEAVSEVRITKGDGRTVKVRLSLESWVQASASRL